MAKTTDAIAITAEGDTDVGQVRSTNQDSYLVEPEQRLFIVADGMGGHAGGEIASQLCVNEISSYVRERPDIFCDGDENRSHPDMKIANTLAASINHASMKIYERSLENPTLRGMGTTATVCKVVDNYAYIAHVGDSRLYLFRCGFLYQITHDHSLVSEQVRAGLLTKEEAELHHLRNVITRSVGYQEEEDVDTTSLKLEDGDQFLLSSDGLHGKVTDPEVAEALENRGVQAVAPLIKLANDRGGDDNVSVVILKVKIHAQ